MDPRERADALLARARARGAFVVTPDNMTSPMDSSNTQQIPASVVAEIDHAQDPDTTTVLPASLIAENDHHLAGVEPTTRLEFGARRQQYQPAAPLVRRAQPSPTPRNPPQEEELDGLVPTVKQNSGR
ncbi:hypothetical protein [Amycolatopsis sp. H20-H5]|uniref:hypothetical protein n=1 Tax=Amycolatopsis sp. H20-H5 TaxID=3046309 RepID=UPI002DBC60D7|nr:hypothetical protein [Amycolatopsis sp. H20-H5]MEC3982804.1 hypothetical protein [Amycolatopsis sp. H20-H5]